MTDLGAVGNTIGGTINPFLAYLVVRPLPFWISVSTRSSTINYFSIDITGSISGVVRRDGVALKDARVFLFYRQQTNWTLIAQKFTSATGTYSFGTNSIPYVGLDKSDNKYLVMVVDPQDSYNAKISDLVTPV
jgi:hypothetical protein